MVREGIRRYEVISRLSGCARYHCETCGRLSEDPDGPVLGAGRSAMKLDGLGLYLNCLIVFGTGYVPCSGLSTKSDSSTYGARWSARGLDGLRLYVVCPSILIVDLS